MSTSKRSLLDGAVGVGGISGGSFLPDYAHIAIADFMLIGGALLVLVRLYLAVREFFANRKAASGGGR